MTDSVCQAALQAEWRWTIKLTPELLSLCWGASLGLLECFYRSERSSKSARKLRKSVHEPEKRKCIIKRMTYSDVWDVCDKHCEWNSLRANNGYCLASSFRARLTIRDGTPLCDAVDRVTLSSFLSLSVITVVNLVVSVVKKSMTSTIPGHPKSFMITWAGRLREKLLALPSLLLEKMALLQRFLPSGSDRHVLKFYDFHLQGQTGGRKGNFSSLA